jgi:hypothetical protein
VTASDLSSCLCSSNNLYTNIVIMETLALTVIGQWRVVARRIIPFTKRNSPHDSVVIKRDELRLEFYD